jgi:hypothetical protein
MRLRVSPSGPLAGESVTFTAAVPPLPGGPVSLTSAPGVADPSVPLLAAGSLEAAANNITIAVVGVSALGEVTVLLTPASGPTPAIPAATFVCLQVK